jgi:hypothetical protein
LPTPGNPLRITSIPLLLKIRRDLVVRLLRLQLSRLYSRVWCDGPPIQERPCRHGATDPPLPQRETHLVATTPSARIYPLRARYREVADSATGGDERRFAESRFQDLPELRAPIPALSTVEQFLDLQEVS